VYIYLWVAENWVFENSEVVSIYFVEDFGGEEFFGGACYELWCVEGNVADGVEEGDAVGE